MLQAACGVLGRQKWWCVLGKAERRCLMVVLGEVVAAAIAEEWLVLVIDAMP